MITGICHSPCNTVSVTVMSSKEKKKSPKEARWDGSAMTRTDKQTKKDRQSLFNLPYLLCREYLPLIWPEPLHPGVGQLDGMDGG